MRLLALAAICSLLCGCPDSGQKCSPTAGDELKPCTPSGDGGAPECTANESCAPFGSGLVTRCMPSCARADNACTGNTICSAVSVGLCADAGRGNPKNDGGDDDAGSGQTDGGDDGGVPPQCVTRFLCYPNRCTQ